MTNLNILVAGVLFVVGCGGKQSPPPNLPVSMENARIAALAAVPGTVEKEEVEQEDGKWVYEFDIKPSAGDQKKEVAVDAHTGKVLEIDD